MLKRISLVFLIILMILCITTQVHAVDGKKQTSLGTIVSDADGFMKAGTNTDIDINEAKIQNMSSFVYNTLAMIGIVIAVVVGMILGVKIAVSGAEEKAQTKELLVPYFIGVFILFGAFAIWKLIVTILQ